MYEGNHGYSVSTRSQSHNTEQHQLPVY